jgi:hypothetical protein
MRHILIACAALVPAWSAASAQESDDLRIRVGLGAQVRPDFIGADGTEVAPLWRVNVARGTNEFKFSAPDYSFGIPGFMPGTEEQIIILHSEVVYYDGVTITPARPSHDWDVVYPNPDHDFTHAVFGASTDLPLDADGNLLYRGINVDTGINSNGAASVINGTRICFGAGNGNKLNGYTITVVKGSDAGNGVSSISMDGRSIHARSRRLPIGVTVESMARNSVMPSLPPANRGSINSRLRTVTASSTRQFWRS